MKRMQIIEQKQLIHVDIATNTIPAPPTYEGDYEVTPQAHQPVELECAGKTMRENVRVKAVPYFETSNVFGKTAYIANTTGD